MLACSLEALLLLLVDLGLSVFFRVVQHDVVEHVRLPVHLLITWEATPNLGQVHVSFLSTGEPMGRHISPVIVNRVAAALIPSVETALEGASSS